MNVRGPVHEGLVVLLVALGAKRGVFAAEDQAGEKAVTTFETVAEIQVRSCESLDPSVRIDVTRLEPVNGEFLLAHPVVDHGPKSRGRIRLQDDARLCADATPRGARDVAVAVPSPEFEEHAPGSHLPRRIETGQNRSISMKKKTHLLH